MLNVPKITLYYLSFLLFSFRFRLERFEGSRYIDRFHVDYSGTAVQHRGSSDFNLIGRYCLHSRPNVHHVNIS